MQLSHLKTLVAIQNTGSFSRAADAVNLSHSAISIQMHQLEQHTGLILFEKGRRPATFTPVGRQFLLKTLAVLEKIDALDQVGKQDETTGTVSIGFVPTTLLTVLPVALGALRARFPALRVTVKSGLSGDLANDVTKQFLDFAFVTDPDGRHPDIVSAQVASEPLSVISERTCAIPRNPFDLFLTRPFIAFSRKSWLGHQIETLLVQAGVPFDPTIELDSIDAVENLVAMGHGVSVVPRRVLAPVHPGLTYSPAPGSPRPARRLSLVSHRNTARKTLRDALVDIVGQQANHNDGLHSHAARSYSLRTASGKPTRPEQHRKKADE